MIDVSEHSTDQHRRIAHLNTHSRWSELAPSVQPLVTESIPARVESFPAALCTIAGEIGSDAADEYVRPTNDDLEDVLEPVVTAVTLLEGYVTLRLAVLHGDGKTTADTPNASDRDAMLLASDYLHAGSYAAVAETPVSDQRRLELYRVSIGGSSELSHRFLGASDATSAPDEDGDTVDALEARASLAETAGVIGATAVGTPTETRTALRRYSHAMMSALVRHSEATAVDADPKTRAARVLFGTTQRGNVYDGAETTVSPAVEDALEAARESLGSLVDSGGIDATSPAFTRLERATHLPFHRD
ncbi:hypothetical protein SAMN05421809_1128 [Natronorubrum daqingense]|uniref:Geranylgeranyl pyrophosphate synthase n=1 Tax=Natronorubrum daqingense TaxID=588898 RepID=A0A1N7ADP1_9EURY|nr:hypothetical protein BB347_16160 [Natronorubrum daqingense]SIR37192.1 hypothetical protein SAMN05421809_1128 [Natronorubrum daqingense]